MDYDNYWNVIRIVVYWIFENKPQTDNKKTLEGLCIVQTKFIMSCCLQIITINDNNSIVILIIIIMQIVFIIVFIF